MVIYKAVLKESRISTLPQINIRNSATLKRRFEHSILITACFTDVLANSFPLYQPRSCHQLSYNISTKHLSFLCLASFFFANDNFSCRQSLFKTNCNYHQFLFISICTADCISTLFVLFCIFSFVFYN